MQAPNPLYSLMFYVIHTWLVYIRMSFICDSYVLVCHAHVTCISMYVTRMYSYAIRMWHINTKMSFLCDLYVLVCHPYVILLYLYVIRISFVCTRLYATVCTPYVTHMYSYVIYMSLVCSRILFVCHSYVLLCYLHATDMWLYHEPGLTVLNKKVAW